MPRQASNSSTNTVRGRGRPRKDTTVSSRNGVATSSSASASSSSNVPTPTVVSGRQLRSRLVPIPDTEGAGSDPTTTENVVRGRRRSQSVTSSSGPAPESCDNRRTRTPRRECTVRTRVEKKARMSLGATFQSPRGPGGLECDLRSATVLSRSTRKTSSKFVNTPKKQQMKKTAQPKQDVQNNEFSRVNCTFAGCHEKVLPSEMESHLSQCSSRQYSCPLAYNDNKDRCQWKGAIYLTLDHIQKDHTFVTCETGPNAVITMKNWTNWIRGTQWATLQTCLGQTFLAMVERKVEHQASVFHGTVQVFGDQKDADRFEFRMTLRKGGENKRILSYSTVVRALNDEPAMQDCFAFTLPHAEIFSHEDDLQVEVSISVMKM